MEITTTWTQLIRAARAGQEYLAAHPGNTKLRYAIERSLPRIAKTNDALQDQLEAIEIEHAATETNKDGQKILMEQAPGVYRFEPERKKARNAARFKLLNDRNVTYAPYYATEVPDDITETDLDAFEGIVIRPEDVEAIRAKREG